MGKPKNYKPKTVNGRPKKELENIIVDGWEVLDIAIVFGSEEYCAEKLGINIDTLAARIKERTGLSFSEYKNKKREGMRVSILQAQYEAATLDKNPTMLIWTGKQHCGQKDQSNIEQNIKIKTIEDLVNERESIAISENSSGTDNKNELLKL